MFEIPLQGGSVNADQRTSIQLGDNFVEFELSYQQSGQWSVDVIVNSVKVIDGSMLEPNADLTENYPGLGIGRLIFTGKDTTLNNLGVENKLVWVES